MSYTLLVIDVQSYFKAAQARRLINNCKREIRQAIKDKAAILLVEYIGCGRSNTSIAKMVEKYDRGFIVLKDDDDGSDEIAETITHFKLPKSRIKVTGVNTDACIQDTVSGLVSKFGRKRLNISIIADACNASSENSHVYGLRYMGVLKKVKLVNDTRWNKAIREGRYYV